HLPSSAISSRIAASAESSIGPIEAVVVEVRGMLGWGASPCPAYVRSRTVRASFRLFSISPAPDLQARRKGAQCTPGAEAVEEYQWFGIFNCPREGRGHEAVLFHRRESRRSPGRVGGVRGVAARPGAE